MQVGNASDAKASGGLLSSFWRGVSVNVMGSNAFTREDIQGALDNMKKKLMERNVAQDIAEKCDLWSYEGVVS